jgi:alpha-1,6-mannosyltransferase
VALNITEEHHRLIQSLKFNVWEAKANDMKICDLIRVYTPTGGGIETYISEKRNYVGQNPHHHHILIIPGQEERVIREGNRSTFVVASPLIHGYEPYRFLQPAHKVMDILLAEQPDVIELEDAHISPWVAFRYRRRRPCSVVGFCHADFLAQQVKPALLRSLGDFLTNAGRRLAERYVSWIYNQCNLAVTASRRLQIKLQDLGVRRAAYIPFGLDSDSSEGKFSWEATFDEIFILYEYLRFNIEPRNGVRSQQDFWE